jgi:hypothetical protein
VEQANWRLVVECRLSSSGSIFCNTIFGRWHAGALIFSAESCLIGKFETRQAPTFNVSSEYFHPIDISKMSAFLKIASRVEAAAAAYISVKDLDSFTDHETWRAEFNGEFVRVHVHGF